MIDLYYWTTPNGHKITIFLEETGLPYTVKPVNIGKGEQFEPAFLAISPNNRIPAIVDHGPPDGGAPLACSSPARSSCISPRRPAGSVRHDLRGRCDVRCSGCSGRWAGLGSDGRPEPSLPAVRAGEDSRTRSTATRGKRGRLYRVLDKRLADREFVAGDYSIADMACYPWMQSRAAGAGPRRFPHLARWHAAIKARPAVERAYAIVERVNKAPSITDEQSRKILFGQDKNTVR